MTPQQNLLTEGLLNLTAAGIWGNYRSLLLDPLMILIVPRIILVWATKFMVNLMCKCISNINWTGQIYEIP